MIDDGIGIAGLIVLIIVLVETFALDGQKTERQLWS